MRNAECGMRNAECGLRNARVNAECGMRNAELSVITLKNNPEDKLINYFRNQLEYAKFIPNSEFRIPN